MARYYASDFDFSKSQQVEAIGTTAFVMRRSTWEGAGLLDERFRWAMVDLAYEYMLGKKGYKLFYTPCAEVIHFGSQTVNQDVLKNAARTMPGLYRLQRRLRLFRKRPPDQIDCANWYSRDGTISRFSAIT